MHITDRSAMREVDGEDVYFEYRFLEDKAHRSERARGARKTDFDYVRTFPLTEGSDLRRELERLLKKRDPVVEFVIKNRRDRTIGEATLNLNDMLDSGRELVMKKLEIVRGGDRIGDFVVTVKGYDAMSQ